VLAGMAFAAAHSGANTPVRSNHGYSRLRTTAL
jgi:hypothetical protein